MHHSEYADAPFLRKP